MLNDAKVFSEKRREDLVTDPNAFVRLLMVRRVLDEREPSFFGIREDIRATTIEQRTDDPVGPSCLDPAEASKTGPPKDPRKHGFGLVILRVSNRDPRCLGLAREFEERLVAKVTRASLNRRPFLRDFDACRPKRDTQGAGEVTNLHNLRRGLCSEAVVDRRGTKRDPHIGSEPIEHVQQRGRIGPSRASDQHVVPGFYERALAEGPSHSRGDHGRTLEHAGRKGKPHLRSVPETPETASETSGFRIRHIHDATSAERNPGHRHTKPRSRPAKQAGAGFDQLEGPLFFLAADLDGRRLVGILPFFSDAFDGDENRRQNPHKPHDERRHRALLTAGFVEGEVPSERATCGTDYGKHRQRPDVGEPCGRWNDETELRAHQPQPDGTLGRCADRLGRKLLGVRHA